MLISNNEKLNIKQTQFESNLPSDSIITTGFVMQVLNIGFLVWTCNFFGLSPTAVSLIVSTSCFLP